MAKTRMYEPWGYRDENEYESSQIIQENDFDSFFSGVEYKQEDNKIHFTNKDGEEVGVLNVEDFVTSGGVIERTEYSDGILKIYFTNGDVVTIDFTEIIDGNEFKDGLIVDDHVVKVLIDQNSESYVSVSENGVKVSGINAAIETETNRATSAETSLQNAITDEITRATAAEASISEEIAAASGDTSELAEKLGLKDNDTLQRTNEHEVAFGTYNISNEDTVLSVGIGTSDADRKNAIEIKQDGSIYMWVEGEFIKINELLAMLAHETY